MHPSQEGRRPRNQFLEWEYRLWVKREVFKNTLGAKHFYVHIISSIKIICCSESLLSPYKFFEQNRKTWFKYVNIVLLAAYFLACYCFYKCGWNKSWKSEARQTFGYLFPQPQSCGEPSTMDQLFANHLNKDYPRISPRDGRNTSSHFVKIAILQGRGNGFRTCQIPTTTQELIKEGILNKI